MVVRTEPHRSQPTSRTPLIPKRTARRVIGTVACSVLLAVAAYAVSSKVRRPFPSDHTPEGAYMRIALGVNQDDPRAFFAYLETDAQWASFTIREMRAKASKRISESYPEPQRTEMLEPYKLAAGASDGAELFARLYAQRGWARRLRKDLSGVAKVEVEGDRASVVTAQGTRWAFRVRDNGIWGITLFTAELLAEASKATRDLDAVSAAAADYDSGRAK